MGQEEIIEKLNIELVKDIKDECQVVYILSRIRKILEIKSQKSKYELLNFYCNWSLHVNLDRKNTTQLISKMFDQCISLEKSAKDMARDIKSAHANFFKLNDFKNEFEEFLKENDLSLSLVNENKCWINFVKLLLKIIEQCPVVCTKSSEKIIKLELIKNKKEEYCYKFNLSGGSRSPMIILKFK